jgi:hypothetical protein
MPGTGTDTGANEGVMVRRPSVASPDSGAESLVYGEAPPVSAEADRGAPAAKPPWSGGGGRWMVWPLRIVLWAVILIVGFRGIMAIATHQPLTGSSGTGGGTGTGIGTDASSADSATGFPVLLGEAFALRFGQVWLNFSPGGAAQRAQQLAPFIPVTSRTTDPQFGWNGAGTSRPQGIQVAGIEARSAQTAVVTLLATVNDQPMELGVPLYVDGTGIVVSGHPAWLPAPPTAQLPKAQSAGSDSAAKNALSSQLPNFFQAYASGDQATLNRYLMPGVSFSGLGGTVSFGSIAAITVPPGNGTRQITVTVDWMLPGQVGLGAPRLATTYDMSVVDQQSGRWYVKDIRASTQPMGPP